MLKMFASIKNDANCSSDFHLNGKICSLNKKLGGMEWNRTEQSVPFRFRFFPFLICFAKNCDRIPFSAWCRKENHWYKNERKSVGGISGEQEHLTPPPSSSKSTFHFLWCLEKTNREQHKFGLLIHQKITNAVQNYGVAE